jgi:glycosyltransferase involved in cell wall biosynthesis
LKVLLVTPMWPSQQKLGYGTFVEQLAKELQKRGVSVTVIGITNPERSPMALLTKYAKLATELIAAKDNYDVVHAHYIFPAGLLAAAYARWRGLPLVLNIAGGDVYEWQRVPFGKLVYRSILASTTKLIFVSQHSLEKAAGFFGNAIRSKSLIIPYGVRTDLFRVIPRDEARRRLFMQTDNVIVLALGSLIWRKGLDVLLRAVSLLDEPARLLVVFVGDGPERPRLHALAAELGIAERVLFAGWVKPESIPVWYAACDIFVSPSRGESYGIALREAMACGKPIVASRIKAYSIAFDEGVEGLFFERDNHKELASKLKTLIRDNELRERMAASATKRARLFSWAAPCNNTIDLYKSLTLRRTPAH